MNDADQDGPRPVQRKPQIFQDEYGYPIPFYLHPSIKLPGARARLTKDIEEHGGIVIDTDAGADTVLVDIHFRQKATLQTGYNGMSDRQYNSIWVEYAPFVQHCIDTHHFGHVTAARKGMGGTTGRQRKPFTPEDDDHLIQYLANLIPDAAAGGRQGDNIYKQLMDLGDLHEEYAWAKNHTAQSWKQRYKKNAEWMNAEIELLVNVRHPSNKQLWPEDRRLGGMTEKQRMLLQEEEEEDSDGDDTFPRLAQRRGGGGDEDAQEGEEEGGKLAKRPAPQHAQGSQNKRRRIESSPQQGTRPERRLSEKARGKQRATQGDDDEGQSELEEGTSLFSVGDEDYQDFDLSQPGPSRSQVEDPHHDRTHGSSTQLPSSVFTGPTLVNSGVSEQVSPRRRSDVARSDLASVREGRLQRVDISGATASFQNALAQSSVREGRGPNLSARSLPQEQPNEITHEQEEEEEHVEQEYMHEQLSPEPEPRLPVPGRRAARRPKFEPEMSPSPERDESDHPSPQFESPPASPPRAPPPPPQPPYRNTRSRSRSVEPSAVQPPASRSRKKPASKTTRQTTIPRELPVVPEHPQHRRESGADERDVEQLLVDQISEPSTSAGPGRGRDSEASMDTDDAQTHQRLQADPSTRPTRNTRRNPFSSLGQPPSEMLRGLNSQKRSTPTSVLGAQAGTTSNSRLPSRRSSRAIATPQTQKGTSRSSTKTKTVKARQQSENRHRTREVPRTPARASHRESDSDGAVFPLPGTLASAKKKELDERDKRTPFRPSIGTRAAEYVRDGLVV